MVFIFGTFYGILTSSGWTQCTSLTVTDAHTHRPESAGLNHPLGHAGRSVHVLTFDLSSLSSAHDVSATEKGDTGPRRPFWGSCWDVGPRQEPGAAVGSRPDPAVAGWLPAGA